jgi:hypothetical protein
MIEADIIHPYPIVHRETNIVRKFLTLVSTSALVLFAFASVASAHDPAASLACVEGTPTLHIALTNYNSGGTNTVKYSIDGVLKLDTTTFLKDYSATVSAGDPFISHTARVVVKAWDDTDGSKGFSVTFTLTVDECQEATPTPTTEQTVEANTGTPAATVANTSLNGNGSSPLPTIMFSMVLLASLGTLAYTNVKVAKASRRNR